jgi:Ca2+-binding RTX toxin-like protein
VSDVRLTRINQDLQLSVVGTTDSLTLQSYFYVESNNSTPYQAYQIQFADGTTWDKAAIRNKVLETAITGTAGNDTLTGGDTNDSISWRRRQRQH